MVVDARGLETDFTLETNRKRVKEKLKTPEFHLSELKFLNIMNVKWKKTHVFYIASGKSIGESD